MTRGQKRFGLALLALAGLNAAGYAAFTLPRGLQERSAAAQLELLRREVAREESRVARLREQVRTARANARDRERFLEGTIQPADAALVPILHDLEAAARGQGLRVGRQSFERSAVKGLPVERFSVRMPLSGSYRQLVGLLRELESSPHFFTLDQISARGEEEGGRVQLDMLLSCYFRRERAS